jgi:hypothetical protein
MKTFTITQQHIFLLQSACLRWDDCEFGAPSVDPQRPYGNSSVYDDIAEILGIKPENADGEFSNAQIDLMDKLHKETLTVLQILIQTGIPAGTYQRDKWGMWNILDDQSQPQQ